MIGRYLFVIKMTRLVSPLFFTVTVLVCQLAMANEVKGLDEIYETPIPSQIRMNFNEAINTHDTCPECVLGILDGEEHFNVFEKKFIVVGVTSNSFGGYWVYIATEGDSVNGYRLWLYDDEDNELDLRSIERMPDSLDKELIQSLWSPSFSRYWQ